MGRRTRSSRKSRRRRNTSPAPKVFAVALIGAAIAGGAWMMLKDDGKGNDLLPPAANDPAASSNLLQAEYTGLTDAEADAVLADVNALLAKSSSATGKSSLIEAYQLMTQVLDPQVISMRPDIRNRMLPTFNKLTDLLFLQPGWSPYRERYEVQSGDSLQVIAKKFGTTEELLCKWNGIDPKKKNIIFPGQMFTVTPGPARIQVDKSDFCLSYFMGDHLVRQYVIGHGLGGITPIGESTIETKKVDPDLNTTDPMKLEMDARWMGLKDFGGRNGIGIHGTHEPETIGKAMSHGCVRMFSHDVEELYDLVPYQTVVRIEA